MVEIVSLREGFEFRDEFRFHFRAFVDLHAGFFPVCGAVAVAGLFADVFVDDVVDFGFVFVCDGDVGFFQDTVEPFPATHKGSPLGGFEILLSW